MRWGERCCAWLWRWRIILRTYLVSIVVLNLHWFCHRPPPTFGSLAKTWPPSVALIDSWWRVVPLFLSFTFSAANKEAILVINNIQPALELWKVLVSLHCGGCFWARIREGVKSMCALVCWGLCLCLIEQHSSCLTSPPLCDIFWLNTHIYMQLLLFGKI